MNKKEAIGKITQAFADWSLSGFHPDHKTLLDVIDAVLSELLKTTYTREVTLTLPDGTKRKFVEKNLEFSSDAAAGFEFREDGTLVKEVRVLIVPMDDRT